VINSRGFVSTGYEGKGGYDYYVGTWHFDEGAGDTAEDSSIFGNTAFLYHPQWVDGIKGKALYFDGINDYALVDDMPYLNFGEIGCFSIDLYIKRCGSLIDMAEGIISKRTGKYHQGYGLAIATNDSVAFIISDRNENHILYSKTPIDDNEWHHIVAVWDGDTQYLYIDDNIDNSAYRGDIIIQDDYKYLEFGNHWGYTDNYHPFHGIIDEIKIATCHPIIKPKENHIYVSDREIMPFIKTVAIGKISFIVDFPYIEKVVFYADGETKYTDYSSPFEWQWNEFSMRRHRIMTLCYYDWYWSNGVIIDEMSIWIFNL